MIKKIEIQELDFPTNDLDCWSRYPKFRWMYETSRLLDAQHISWNPYQTEQCSSRMPNVELLDSKGVVCHHLGYVYIQDLIQDLNLTEVFIIKGQIKYLRHIESGGSLDGNIELHISAFVTLHFQKFTGVVTLGTHANNVFSVKLRPVSELGVESNDEIIKLLKRIYKKNIDIN